VIGDGDEFLGYKYTWTMKETVMKLIHYLVSVCGYESGGIVDWDIRGYG
jgi:hypothetical protein